MRAWIGLILIPLGLMAQPQLTRLDYGRGGEGGYPSISDTNGTELLLQWGWVDSGFDSFGAVTQCVSAEGQLIGAADYRETGMLSSSCLPYTNVVRNAVQYSARLTSFP